MTTSLPEEILKKFEKTQVTGDINIDARSEFDSGQGALFGSISNLKMWADFIGNT